MNEITFDSIISNYVLEVHVSDNREVKSGYFNLMKMLSRVSRHRVNAAFWM